MKKLIIVSRLAFLLLLLIAIEGLLTMGIAFEFEKYSIVGWITQVCLFIILIRASVFSSLWTNPK